MKTPHGCCHLDTPNEHQSLCPGFCGFSARLTAELPSTRAMVAAQSSRWSAVVDWTEDLITQLRLFWDEGHSTAEIGRRLGVSKNAVVGKAHRLELPARPSPIRRMQDGMHAGARPAARPAPPADMPGTVASQRDFKRSEPAHSVAAQSGAPTAEVGQPEIEVASKPEPNVAAPPADVAKHRPALRTVAAPVRSGARPSPCCWPIGEPGTRGFHFCSAQALPGKPYCAQHAQLAYVKVRDRREEAA